VTILVDAPTWPWRGRLWAHVTSDVSLVELHEFAEHLEIPRRGFGGDHYDVPEEYVARVVAAGAVVVTGRELVARLTAAGLRRRRTVAPLAPRVVLAGHQREAVAHVLAERTGWPELAGLPDQPGPYVASVDVSVALAPQGRVLLREAYPVYLRSTTEDSTWERLAALVIEVTDPSDAAFQIRTALG
jgi:Protein of unknown function (DUF4031)